MGRERSRGREEKERKKNRLGKSNFQVPVAATVHISLSLHPFPPVSMAHS